MHHVGSVKAKNLARRAILIMVPLLLSVSCIAGDAQQSKETGISKHATVLWLDTCKEEKEVGFVLTLIAALAPKLISAGTAQLSKTLANKSEQYQVVHSGRAADMWGTAQVSKDEKVQEPKPGAVTLSLGKRCVIAYGGDSGPWATTGPDSAQRSFYPAVIQSLTYRPAIFFMASIEYQPVAQRGVVFRVIPEKFAMNSATSRGSGPKDIVATLRFTVPSPVVDTAYSTEAVLQPISQVQVGQALSLRDMTSDWLSFPTISGKSGEERVPIFGSVQVTVLETDAGGGATIYKALSDLLQQSKDEIAKAASDSLAKGEDQQKSKEVRK